jgi:hypothetical protein
VSAQRPLKIVGLLACYHNVFRLQLPSVDLFSASLAEINLNGSNQVFRELESVKLFSQLGARGSNYLVTIDRNSLVRKGGDPAHFL